MTLKQHCNLDKLGVIALRTLKARRRISLLFCLYPNSSWDRSACGVRRQGLATSSISIYKDRKFVKSPQEGVNSSLRLRDFQTSEPTCSLIQEKNIGKERAEDELTWY